MHIALAIWNKPDMTPAEAIGVAAVGILVVLLELSLLSGFIKILSKIIGVLTGRKKQSAPQTDDTQAASQTSPAPAAPPVPAADTGSVELVNVDEPTAACIMAIVSDRSGIPLSRLKFRSIKLIEDKQ